MGTDNDRGISDLSTSVGEPSTTMVINTTNHNNENDKSSTFQVMPLKEESIESGSDHKKTHPPPSIGAVLVAMQFQQIPIMPMPLTAIAQRSSTKDLCTKV
ncbi:hypothetical protein PTKIN_Ptkin04bG0195300 [Pterospermum kingtungense]